MVMRGLLSYLRLIAKGKQKTNCPDVMDKQSLVPVHLITTNTSTTFRTSVRRVITNAYFKVAVRNSFTDVSGYCQQCKMINTANSLVALCK